MSDDEESTRREQEEEEEEEERKSSSSDDDSSSSSSGSSSSSDSSDSESDGEENEGKAAAADGGDGPGHASAAAARKLSSDGQSAAHNFSKSALAQATAAEMNINPNRAAARFREQNSTQTMGLMALGTKKRDRRTIEEIQRDLQRKRGKKPLPGAAAGGNNTLAARSSPPPRGSPIRSPESGGSTGGDPAAVMSQQLGYGGLGGANGRNGVRKPVSARDRLEIKLKGRRTNASAPAPGAKGRKPAVGSASTTGGGAGAGMVTNISAGKPAKASVGGGMSDHDSVTGDIRPEPSLSTASGSSASGSAGQASSSARMEPKIEAKIVDVRPDARIVRALLRAMLRYGDLTDVHMFPGAPTFADEYKQPNFVERSNLVSTTKMTMGRLLGVATEIAERAQAAVENKQDSMKYCEVEIKPSQVIERLYENLKLRVAVQRALRDANCPKNGANGAYVLVAKQCDLPLLGIPRDFPAWFWAEKEHDWNSRKDAALLLGIYVHGFGGWEDILNDDLLHFQQQRALKGERMKKRAENLLKRLPSPDNSGEPKFVNAASALALGPQNSNQSMGAHFSAILHNNGTGKGGPVIVSASSGAAGGLGVGSGRLQRAAERAAARQQAGVGAPSSIPEDSIRRMSSQHSSNGSHSGGSDGGGSNYRYRKSSAASSPNDNAEPEDGEIDMDRDRPVIKSQSSSRATSPVRRPSSSSGKPRRSDSSTSSKRSASAERGDENGEVPSKRRKGGEESERRPSSAAEGRTHSSISSSRRRLLSEDECYDKWKPNKKLKDIRQVLKKMKIMAAWSKNQKDSVVVEKVFKYVTTIGEAIDKIVRKAEPETGALNGNSDKNERPADEHEWDELCSCLWAYAAGYTPFSSQTFERLYGDICADGDVLRTDRRRAQSSSSR